MGESLDSRALSAVSDAVLTIAAERSFEPVLKKLADAARELADARYAAIGVPDGEGGFANFITSGMTDKQWEAIGELPRQHGLLGFLERPEPFTLTSPRGHAALLSQFGSSATRTLAPVLPAGATEWVFATSANVGWDT